MTKEKHIERHRMLHDRLDELVADLITHTKGLPSRATVLELMEWSAKQVENPDPDEGGSDD